LGPKNTQKENATVEVRKENFVKLFLVGERAAVAPVNVERRQRKKKGARTRSCLSESSHAGGTGLVQGTKIRRQAEDSATGTGLREKESVIFWMGLGKNSSIQERTKDSPQETPSIKDLGMDDRKAGAVLRALGGRAHPTPAKGAKRDTLIRKRSRRQVPRFGTKRRIRRVKDIEKKGEKSLGKC